MFKSTFGALQAHSPILHHKQQVYYNSYFAQKYLNDAILPPQFVNIC